MTRAPSIAGVILAAGESSRMGAEKALLPWPPCVEGQSVSSESFLSAAIRSLLAATDFVVVVVGKNEAALAPVVYAQGASIVVNRDTARGQFSSLQLGLHEVLNQGRDAAMITLVDRPPVRPSTLQTLRDAFEVAEHNVWAVVPEFSGAHGHPYLVGREMMSAFLQASPAATARDVEHEHQARIQYVAVADPLVVLNINTPEEYAALPARSS
jgi:molybdenum cofactor cytidylyltransferase